MSASPNAPGAQRAQAIREALEDLALALDDLREVQPQINDPALRSRFDAFLAAASAMLEAHGAEPGPSLPAEAHSLRDGIRQMAIPSRDPELGRTESLRRAQAAEGLFSARLDRLTGLLPATAVSSETVPRAETGAAGEGIEARLQSLEASIQALREAERTGTNFLQQQGLINLYIKEARTEIALARFLAKIGETKLDLGAIQAAAQRLATLTGDFVAMVNGWAGRVSDWLPPLGERLRQGAAGVLKAVRLGWRVVRWRREAAAAAAAEAKPVHAARPEDAVSTAEAPSDFDLDRVVEMILDGHPPPEAWRPRILDLDLSTKPWFFIAGGSRSRPGNLSERLRAFQDLKPLEGLTALQSLSLSGTQVADLTPLEGLTALQRLHLDRTQVTDLAPLKGLTALQSLYLTSTKVGDLTPLEGLTALQRLDLRGTQVTDLTPLDALPNLRRLWLSQSLRSAAGRLRRRRGQHINIAID